MPELVGTLGFPRIVARLEQYEQMNAIPAYKKMAKIMKDTMKQEEASEKVEPGWRSSASPEEIVKRQEAAQERARESYPHLILAWYAILNPFFGFEAQLKAANLIFHPVSLGDADTIPPIRAKQNLKK
ncbi:unnamed protein product, partial [Cladocopium goreaui]